MNSNTTPLKLQKHHRDSIQEAFENLIRYNEDPIYEVEARLGTINDKKSGERINIRAKHPIIFKKLPDEFRFVSGVADEYFECVKKTFESLKNGRKTKDKVVFVKDIRKIYKEGDPNPLIMKKTRVRSFEIHFPGNEYDVRISISYEKIINEEMLTRRNTNFTIRSGAPKFDMVRKRDRISYFCGLYLFEFTSVSDDVCDLSKEVEIEVGEYEFDKIEFFDILNNISNIKK